MVFQAYTSFGWLTVRQNVEYGLRLQGVSKAQRRQRSDKYLQAVGLTEFADHYPKELSGGMKQRVAIARTRINEPRIVLMDEPFGALDPQTRWGMQGLLLDVSRTEDNTILFVTHDITEAVYLADTVYVLSPRPAQVLHRVDVPFFAQRDISLQSTPEFRAVEQELLGGCTTIGVGVDFTFCHLLKILRGWQFLKSTASF
jgi:NitT/TauT family transport system ATP-binding protein